VSDDRGHLDGAAPVAAQGRRWNQRAFVVTGAPLSGLAVPISGLADHAAGGPGGSAVGWSIVHTSLGALFVGFCVRHAARNRRALLRNLRAGIPAHALPTREVLVALALVGGVLALTATHALVGS
jgi:hypothetical protein